MIRATRAVLADCERALGRADVALRLVAEAMAEGSDADEALELRIVEAGARRDLGEDAAARLVLEGALGGRTDPAQLDGANAVRLRLSAAYVDLLRAQGEDELADRWLSAVVAADPDNLSGAIDHPEIEFIDLEDEFDGDLADVAGNSRQRAQSQPQIEAAAVSSDGSPAPEVVDPVARGRSWARSELRRRGGS